MAHNRREPWAGSRLVAVTVDEKLNARLAIEGNADRAEARPRQGGSSRHAAGSDLRADRVQHALADRARALGALSVHEDRPPQSGRLVLQLDEPALRGRAAQLDLHRPGTPRRLEGIANGVLDASLPRVRYRYLAR